jgi:hypothetical protein
MANARRIVVWSTVTLLVSAAQTHAVHPLAGTWVNVEAKTGSITRLEVREEAGGWVIHAWGSCAPTDCDWGVVPLHMAVDVADAHKLDAARFALKAGRIAEAAALARVFELQPVSQRESA